MFLFSFGIFLFREKILFSLHLLEINTDIPNIIYRPSSHFALGSTSTSTSILSDRHVVSSSFLNTVDIDYILIPLYFPNLFIITRMSSIRTGVY